MSCCDFTAADKLPFRQFCLIQAGGPSVVQGLKSALESGKFGTTATREHRADNWAIPGARHENGLGPLISTWPHKPRNAAAGLIASSAMSALGVGLLAKKRSPAVRIGRTASESHTPCMGWQFPVLSLLHTLVAIESAGFLRM